MGIALSPTFRVVSQRPCWGHVTGAVMSKSCVHCLCPHPWQSSPYIQYGIRRTRIWVPTIEQGANLCFCSTVAYNLLSACSVCQGGDLRTWSDYSHNCTKTMDPSTFPNPVPPEVRVPQWALRDVTLVNLWDATTAFTMGGRPLFLYGFRLTDRLSSDTPEILPGELIGTSPSSSISPTSSTSSSAPASTSSGSTSSGSGSNAGAIAGGVAGGVVGIAAIVGLLFVIRRRQQRTQVPVSCILGQRHITSAISVANEPNSSHNVVRPYTGTPVDAISVVLVAV
ncbi:hypothetical protein EDB87DRAFT_503959 [Lactarius vividus]|nr:hypothetical protein EDB87DRAFT_503959 [Lactarius vividus]